MRLDRRLFASLLASIVIGAALWQAAASPALTSISRSQFAEYVQSLSEPEGFFDTDNFISNETSYLHVVPDLKRRVRPGSVYMGVGPDQNFSYIVHAQPSLAIITDIRRQNMLEHLLYKALFDLSNSRAEFLGMLFSREAPKVDSRAPLRDLLRAVRAGRTSEERFRTNLAAIRGRLLQTYGLKLSAQDLGRIEYVYGTLREEG